MPIDPKYLDEPGIIAFDETLSTDERRRRLQELLLLKPQYEGVIKGYGEMLSNLDSIDEAQYTIYDEIDGRA